MEIFNRINTYISNYSDIKKKAKQKHKTISFSGYSNFSSASAIESMAKAKIIMDKTYNRPLSYEEKIKILKEKKIPEKYFELFISQNDEEFKTMIEYIDLGLKPEQINSIYSNSWDSEKYKKAGELSRYNIPFDFAKDLYSYSNIPEERIEFLKQAKFDFSSDKSNFKIDTYRLKNILRRDEEFKKFHFIYQFGVAANVALAATKLNEEEYRKLSEILEGDKELNNSAASAYFLSGLTQEEIEKIIEISKTHKLDFNNYDSWINIKNSRGINNAIELLNSGIPADCLKKNVCLNNEQMKDALSLAKKYDISESDAIDIYQYTTDDEQRREKTCKLLKEQNLDISSAYTLSRFDENIINAVLGYIAIGIDFNNALNLALLKKEPSYKERIIELLNTFKNVNDAETFLNMDLSPENRAKFINLIEKGANLYFANFCIESPASYNKVMSLYESGAFSSLDGLYGGFEEEVLKELDYISYGVPKENISFFLNTATPEQIELLKSGVKYEALKPLKEYEESGNDSSVIKEYLKKGTSFETALNLQEISESADIPQDILTDNIYPSLNAKKILTLANLQKNRGANWINGKEKDLLIEFTGTIKNVQNLEEFIDSGFLNEKALINYKEFAKRGISEQQSDNALFLSQLDYNNSAQYDRATELLKRNVPFDLLLFSIKDDKSFIEAIQSMNKKENNQYNYNSTLNSYLVKFYQLGFNAEEIHYIAENCCYFDKENFAEILKYINKGHNLKDAIKIAAYKYYERGSMIEDKEKSAQNREIISDLVKQGCNFDFVKNLFFEPKTVQRLQELIKQGIEPNLAEKIAMHNINIDDGEKIAKIQGMEKSTIKEDLKKFCGNPALYLFIDELYSFDTYSNYQYGQILKSNISLQDILSSAKIFIKSPLKQAMKRPHVYLSGIPIEDTEKVNGQYPKLTDEKMQKYQHKMLLFFKSNIIEITRALKYLDIDTFNQLMDKRTNNFSEQLEMLNKMDDTHYTLVSKLTKCRKEDGKLLSSKEKIDLAKIVLYHQLGYLDVSYLEEIANTGTVDIPNLRKMLFKKLMDTIGLTEEEVQKYANKLDFDEEYMYLLLRTQKSADFMWIKNALDDENQMERTISFLENLLKNSEELAHNGLTEEKAIALLDLLRRANTMEEKDVYKEFSEISPFESVNITAHDIALLAIKEDFKSYIQDDSNPIGKVNSQTKEQFEKLGLNYEKWLNFSEKDSVEFNGNKFNIQLWNRYPQKDLFMGNRTSCCTAIIDGGNGKATPIYLANTAFNVVEVKDENDNIVAMSRIFVGIVDEEPSLIIENIEVNNSFIKNKTPEELKLLRDKMFSYILDLGTAISDNKDMNIYFSKNYSHVPMDDYSAQKKNIDFVGSISSDNIYLNTKPGWTKPQELKNQPCDLYLI